MREVDVFIAGIGGQGSLLIGQTLAEAAIREGLNTTWVPIYGVEKRGGDATVTLIISEDEIGSPLLAQVNNMIVMHQRAWEKHRGRIKKGGLLIVNSSIVEVDPEDYEALLVPATDMAISMGSERVANFILLGVFLKRRPIVPLETLKEVIKTGSKSEKMAQMNIKALERGYMYE